MNSSELRKEARNKLTGKWGKVALITLAYVFILFVISFIQNYLTQQASNLETIFSLIVAIIEVPLSFGLLLSFFQLYNNEETKAFDFISLGFSNFGKAWGLAFRLFLKLIVPIILLIVSLIVIGIGIGITSNLDFVTNPNIPISSISTGVSGVAAIGTILYIASIIWLIVRSYTYQLSYIIAADNKELSSVDAVNKSAELMNGNRFKLFCLQFSFIGWAILASFTLGIGFLWLSPYIQFSIFAFYKYLSEKNV